MRKEKNKWGVLLGRRGRAERGGRRRIKLPATIAALALCTAVGVLGPDLGSIGNGQGLDKILASTPIYEWLHIDADDETQDVITFSAHGGAAQTIRIPTYRGEASVALNDNRPDFDEADLTTEAFEDYSDLDDLGRCGGAYANICKGLMPTEKRGSIGMIRPTGWQTARYDDLITTKYLYNRCHLIAYSLAGENANERNLITGTRYMNENMIPYENEVADYVRETDGHVLYRVTPVFEGENLLASGVEIEAMSVEDRGKSVAFHVFLYNVQPGIEIDYATGQNQRAEDVGDAEAAAG